MADGSEPRNQRYLGGYYFNDALLRLDIAYENAVRDLTELHGPETIDVLIAAANRKGHDAATFREWEKIHDEVNALKHRGPEQTTRHRRGKAVSNETALVAAEKIATFLEKIVHGRSR